jgi:hypothetical protein
MRLVHPTAIVALLAVATMLVVSADAQKSEQGAPVDLAATPSLARRGASVELSGTTFTDGKRFDVRIVVTPPKGAGQPVTLAAKAHPETGQFATTFTGTNAPGQYTVAATSPDGKGQGSATFTIVDPSGMAAAAANTLGEIADVASGVFDDAIKTATAAPGSEAQQALGELQQIAPRLQQLVADIAAVKEGVSSLPAAPGTEQALESLGDWTTEAADDIGKLRARLDAARARKGPSVCDHLELTAEALSAITAAFTLAARGAQGIGQLILGAPTPGDYRNVQGNIKRLIEGLSFMTTRLPQGMFYLLLDRLCTSYIGPVQATATVEFSEGGRPWWRYGMRLDGRIVLHFLRNAPVGQPIRITGYFEGNATDFSFWEDIFVVEPLPKGFVLLARKRVPPVGFAATTKSPLDLGLFARALTPKYFYCPIEGELTGDTIRFKVIPSKMDLDDSVQNVVLIAAINPLYPLPLVHRSRFPVQKASWLFERGTIESPELTIRTEGKASVIERTITRDASAQGGETKAKFVIKISAKSGS